MKSIDNRLRYKGENLSPRDIRSGFSIAKIAPKVSIFRPALARYIIKIYLDELENNAISKFEDAGFSVEKCVVDAVLDTTKKNAGIHLITIKVRGPADEGELAKVAKEISDLNANIISAVTTKQGIDNKIMLTIKATGLDEAKMKSIFEDAGFEIQDIRVN